MVGREPLGVEAVAELGPQGPLPIRREAGFGSVFAALDLGTNNCRLLVARPLIEGGFRVVDAFSRIVRLGEGVSATGRLSEAAMARTLDPLRVCAVKIQRRGAPPHPPARPAAPPPPPHPAPVLPRG